MNFGPLRGTGRVVYTPANGTVRVTFDASGVTPGMHAVHIHAGTCAAQGAPSVMFPQDFTADRHGRIHATEVAHNVTSAQVAGILPAGRLYVNLHQGTMNSILTAAGTPALSFRPLLCGNM